MCEGPFPTVHHPARLYHSLGTHCKYLHFAFPEIMDRVKAMDRYLPPMNLELQYSLKGTFRPFSSAFLYNHQGYISVKVSKYNCGNK